MKIKLEIKEWKKSEDTMYWEDNFSGVEFEELEDETVDMWVGSKRYLFEKSELIKLLKVITS